MPHIRDFHIRTRLLFSFGLMSLVIVLLALLSMRGLDEQRTDLDAVMAQNAKVAHLEDMYNAVNEIAIGTRDLVLAEGSVATGLSEQVRQGFDKYQRAHDQLYQSPVSGQGASLRQQIDAAMQSARPLQEHVIALGRENQDEEALQVLQREAAPAMAKLRQLITDNIRLQHQLNQHDYQRAVSAHRWAINELWTGVAVALALTVGLSVLNAQSIASPLETAQNVVGRIANGELSTPIPAVSGRDETAELVRAIGRMRDGLQQICREITGSAHGLAHISSQMAQGTQDLSQRTEEQSSSLVETAASMQQLGSTAHQNADHVRQASVLALEASNVAGNGGAIVGQVVHTMKDIHEASRKIEDIIGVIDGIAFQTNILALNASVEAARAGEQGRGFAVVASEVRSLAQRSAEAAKEIKGLISNNVERVSKGATLADQAGEAMSGVVDAIRRVTDLMNGISMATQEQSAGVAQVGSTLSEMDRATQQNAALVEESAGSANQLQQQAQHLLQVISAFK